MRVFLKKQSATLNNGASTACPTRH